MVKSLFPTQHFLEALLLSGLWPGSVHAPTSPPWVPALRQPSSSLQLEMVWVPLALSSGDSLGHSLSLGEPPALGFAAGAALNCWEIQPLQHNFGVIISESGPGHPGVVQRASFPGRLSTMIFAVACERWPIADFTERED